MFSNPDSLSLPRPPNERPQGRYSVCTATGRRVSLKPSKIVLSDGTVVTLDGLTKGGLNGEMGTVQGGADGRYNVRLDGGRVVAVKRENCRV